MGGGPLISIVTSGASRWARLVPGLLRHDPLFRYAAIAAALALVFLAARLAQDFAGPGEIPPAGSDRIGDNVVKPADRLPTGEEPPRPGSATTPPETDDTTPSAIAPGRSLEGIEVEPASRDRFGTLPREGSSQ